MTAPAPERVTSVYMDGNNTVVGGYDDGTYDALVWQLLPDASPDPSFGTSGLATLPWTGLPSLSSVESHVHPGATGQRLVIGIWVRRRRMGRHQRGRRHRHRHDPGQHHGVTPRSTQIPRRSAPVVQ